MDMKVTEITGRITLSDGSSSEFYITTDGGWNQWGASRERLGQTSDVLSTIADALLEDTLLATSYDEEE